MLKNREFSAFFLLSGLFFYSSLLGEVAIVGLRIAPTQPETWTNIGFSLHNTGKQPENLTLKVVTGAIDNASSFSFELSIPPACAWEMHLPLMAPPREKNEDLRNQRKFDATVYLHRGGALLHREALTVALLQSEPHQFLEEGFEKPTDRWSVDGLWNHQEWGHQFGNIGPDLEERRLRGTTAKLASPFLSDKLKNRIVVLESMESLGPFECSELLKWLEKGGFLILSEASPSRQLLHETLSFLPIGETWISLGADQQPFKGMSYHFQDPWKIWRYDGKELGAWREVGHGSLLVTQVPMREILGSKIVNWATITDNWMPPSHKQVWDEARGLAWMNQELLSASGSGMWSRNLVGIYLASLLFLGIALAQLPALKQRREWRWALWCGLSLVWSLGGFLFHILNTDSSTRMDSVEMVLKRVGTAETQSWGLSKWQSGSKRRLDLGMGEASWKLDGSQDVLVSSGHRELKGWELRPGESKTLEWTSPSRPIRHEDPDLKIGLQSLLSVPDGLQGQSAILVIGHLVWNFEKLESQLKLDPKLATNILTYQGPFSFLFKAWTHKDRRGSKVSRPEAWLFIKSPNPVVDIVTPSDVVRNEQQWIWFTFPTTAIDQKSIQQWASHSGKGLPSSFVSFHSQTSSDLP